MATGSVDEDDLDNAASTGTSPNPPVTAVVDVSTLVTVGADEDATYGFISDTTDLGVLLTALGLTSDTDAIDTVVFSTGTGTETLTFGTAADGGRDVFSLTIDTDSGEVTFELLDQLDHPLTDDPSTTGTTETAFEDTLTIDFSGFVTVSDADNDTVTLADDSFKIDIVDDIPEVSTSLMVVARAKAVRWRGMPRRAAAAAAAMQFSNWKSPSIESARWCRSGPGSSSSALCTHPL